MLFENWYWRYFKTLNNINCHAKEMQQKKYCGMGGEKKKSAICISNINVHDSQLLLLVTLILTYSQCFKMTQTTYLYTIRFALWFMLNLPMLYIHLLLYFSISYVMQIFLTQHQPVSHSTLFHFLKYLKTLKFILRINQKFQFLN